MKLPPEIERIVYNRGYGDIATEDTVDPETKAKLKQLRDQVHAIETTETTLQMDYWGLRGAGARASNLLRQQDKQRLTGPILFASKDARHPSG